MLDVTRLKAALLLAFVEDTEESDSAAATDRVCTKMAQAIVDEIKQVKINYVNGLTAPNGPVGGVINHTVN